MRQWDLNAGAGKLELAYQELKKARLRISTEWDDSTYREFQETFLDPLEPLLRHTMEAIGRMADVLSKAERECGAY